MFTKNLAFELDDEGIAVVSIHPGWVRTDMGGPKGDIGQDESVEGIIETLSRLTKEQYGKCISYKGEIVAD